MNNHYIHVNVKSKIGKFYILRLCEGCPSSDTFIPQERLSGHIGGQYVNMYRTTLHHASPPLSWELIIIEGGLSRIIAFIKGSITISWLILDKFASYETLWIFNISSEMMDDCNHHKYRIRIFTKTWIIVTPSQSCIQVRSPRTRQEKLWSLPVRIL